MESTLLCIHVVHRTIRIGQVCCDHGHGGAWAWQIVTYIFLPSTHIWVAWKRFHQLGFRWYTFRALTQGTPYLGTLQKANYILWDLLI